MISCCIFMILSSKTIFKCLLVIVFLISLFFVFEQIETSTTVFADPQTETIEQPSTCPRYGTMGVCVSNSCCSRTRVCVEWAPNTCRSDSCCTGSPRRSDTMNCSCGNSRPFVPNTCVSNSCCTGSPAIANTCRSASCCTGSPRNT